MVTTNSFLAKLSLIVKIIFSKNRKEVINFNQILSTVSLNDDEYTSLCKYNTLSDMLKLLDPQQNLLLLYLPGTAHNRIFAYMENHLGSEMYVEKLPEIINLVTTLRLCQKKYQKSLHFSEDTDAYFETITRKIDKMLEIAGIEKTNTNKVEIYSQLCDQSFEIHGYRCFLKALNS
jgi:hypothetical protein